MSVGKLRRSAGPHGVVGPKDIAEARGVARAFGDRTFASGGLAAACLFALIGSSTGQANAEARWSGWLQGDAAYAWPSPGRFTNLRTLGELSGRGTLGGGLKWKLSAQAGFDAAYGVSDRYPAAVRQDQRTAFALREAYLDFSHGDWEFRLGKQNIVWGEMVGLFFADVVSAKDLRSSILPEFDQIRIPQWAARAEWYGERAHVEMVWLPAPEVDDIGKPGSEFFAGPLVPPGLAHQVIGEQRPRRNLSNSGAGLRVSTLVGGWDLSGFVYRAPDTQAAFRRTVDFSSGAPAAYQAWYPRVTRIGATVAKDFSGIVAKAEAVYTKGRRFSRLPPDTSDGLAKLDSLDWVMGVDLTPANGWRVNAQVFQRAFLDYEPAIGMDRRENGASLLVSHALNDRLDLEFLGITSLNRSDRLLRLMMSWRPDAHRRIRAGIDVFSGSPYGMFGRFDDSDRIWGEYRYSF